MQGPEAYAATHPPSESIPRASVDISCCVVWAHTVYVGFDRAVSHMRNPSKRTATCIAADRSCLGGLVIPITIPDFSLSFWTPLSSLYTPSNSSDVADAASLRGEPGASQPFVLKHDLQRRYVGNGQRSASLTDAMGRLWRLCLDRGPSSSTTRPYRYRRGQRPGMRARSGDTGRAALSTNPRSYRHRSRKY
jgi:hypothetical protein